MMHRAVEIDLAESRQPGSDALMKHHTLALHVGLERNLGSWPQTDGDPRIIQP